VSAGQAAPAPRMDPGAYAALRDALTVLVRFGDGDNEGVGEALDAAASLRDVAWTLAGLAVTIAANCGVTVRELLGQVGRDAGLTLADLARPRREGG
jgi:hypothetical protein